MSVCVAPTCSHQSFDGSSYYVDVDSMSDYGVKIGIKADTGIMLMKPSTVSAVVNVVGS